MAARQPSVPNLIFVTWVKGPRVVAENGRGRPMVASQVRPDPPVRPLAHAVIGTRRGIVERGLQLGQERAQRLTGADSDGGRLLDAKAREGKGYDVSVPPTGEP